MSFAGYPDFESCVRANKGKVDDPEAYCAAIQRKVEGGEFTVTEASEGKKLLLNVEIFQTGIHVPAEGMVKNWTRADIQDVVDAFHEGVNSPVHLKVGHTSPEFCSIVAQRLGIPIETVKGEGLAGNGMISLGRMVDARLRDDGVIVADFEAPEAVADLIERGYTDVSVEMEAGYPGHPWVLSAVALLGAERPAVKGLAGLEEQAVLVERVPALVARFSATPHGLVQFQNDPVRICGHLWFNGTDAQRGAFGNGSEGRGRNEKPPAAWWDDCVATIGGSRSQEHTDLSLEELEEVSSQMEQFIKGKKAAAFLRQAWGQIKEKWAALLGLGAHPEQLHQEDDMDIKKFAERLRMQEGATEDQVLTRLDQLMEAVAAIAQALGLGGAPEEIPTPEEMAAKVKELQEKAKTSQFSAGEMGQRLQAAEGHVAVLERDKRMSQYREFVRPFTAIEGKPDDLASELIELEDKVGKEAAQKQLARWGQTQKYAQQAGVLERIGTARDGGGKSAIETEMDEWVTKNPDKTLSDAYAHFRKNEPEKWREFRASARDGEQEE